MHRTIDATIDAKRDRIAEVCRRFHVRRLDLFGSAIGEAFEASRSDVDVLVEFGPLPPGAYADAWFGLREGLEALFGRPVDLVTADAVRNPYFRSTLEQTRRPLYAA